MKALPPDVAAMLATVPQPARGRMRELRKIIFAAARVANVGEIEETLKWGQPAYLPAPPRIGTTLRLGWSKTDPERIGVYVHCQTRLLDRYRERFPTEFVYEGNRALKLPVNGPFEETALHQVAVMALTYHHEKKA